MSRWGATPARAGRRRVRRVDTKPTPRRARRRKVIEGGIEVAPRAGRRAAAAAPSRAPGRARPATARAPAPPAPRRRHGGGLLALSRELCTMERATKPMGADEWLARAAPGVQGRAASSQEAATREALLRAHVAARRIACAPAKRRERRAVRRCSCGSTTWRRAATADPQLGAPCATSSPMRSSRRAPLGEVHGVAVRGDSEEEHVLEVAYFPYILYERAAPAVAQPYVAAAAHGRQRRVRGATAAPRWCSPLRASRASGASSSARRAHRRARSPTRHWPRGAHVHAVAPPDVDASRAPPPSSPKTLARRVETPRATHRVGPRALRARGVASLVVTKKSDGSSCSARACAGACTRSERGLVLRMSWKRGDHHSSFPAHSEGRNTSSTPLVGVADEHVRAGERACRAAPSTGGARAPEGCDAAHTAPGLLPSSTLSLRVTSPATPSARIACTTLAQSPSVGPETEASRHSFGHHRFSRLWPTRAWAIRARAPPASLARLALAARHPPRGGHFGASCARRRGHAISTSWPMRARTSSAQQRLPSPPMSRSKARHTALWPGWGCACDSSWRTTRRSVSADTPRSTMAALSPTIRRSARRGVHTLRRRVPRPKTRS